MRYRIGKTVVVALGGSIVYPSDIDVAYLKKFRKFISRRVEKGAKFVIVMGGGHLARLFQKAAHEISALADEDRDWIGIHATRLNGHLLRTIFRDVADPVIIDARHKLKRLTHPVTIASGWRPGWSTDFVAAAIAADFHIPEFVVAGRPAFVYDRDPHGPPVGGENAKPFEAISWSAYRKLIPRKWVPGSHAPVDPIAARLAQKEKLAAIVVDGRDLANFGRLLKNREFEGTIIQ